MSQNIKNIENGNPVLKNLWLSVSIISFLLFVFGLVLLILGVVNPNIADIVEFMGMNSAVIGFLLIIIGILVMIIGITKTVHNMKIEKRRLFKNLGTAYAYISPAIIGMVILVFFPLVFGVWIAFTNYSREIGLTHDRFKFPTLERFFEVFTSKNSDFWDIFFVNIWWTVINIVLSASLGVAMALILNREDMKFKKLYRTLLVLPWADRKSTRLNSSH